MSQKSKDCMLGSEIILIHRSSLTCCQRCWCDQYAVTECYPLSLQWDILYCMFEVLDQDLNWVTGSVSVSDQPPQNKNSTVNLYNVSRPIVRGVPRRPASNLCGNSIHEAWQTQGFHALSGMKLAKFWWNSSLICVSLQVLDVEKFGTHWPKTQVGAFAQGTGAAVLLKCWPYDLQTM